MTSHLLQVLSDTPLFQRLPPERMPRVASIFSVRTYDRGEQIIGPHDPQDRTYVVGSGVARALAMGADGRAIAVGLLDPGDVFGRLPLGVEGSDERVEAIERCVVLRASAADFERLVIEEPAVAVAAVGALGARARAAEERMAALSFQQVPARLAQSIVDLADRFGKVTPTGVRVDVRITHGQLAELVATTRETLTKVAGWLRSEGIATLERRQIWVHDYDGLLDVAGGVRQMPGRTQRQREPVA